MIRTKHIYALCLLLSLGYTSGLSVLNDTSIKECDEGLLSMVDCNRCYCIDSLVSCSDNTCAHNTECAVEGATWKDGCNFCYCFDGQASCSDNTCLPKIERNTLIELSGSDILLSGSFLSDPDNLFTEDDIWKPDSRPWFLIFDFIETYKVNNVTIINTGDSVHDVTSFKIESSNDNQEWTLVKIITKVAPGDDQPQFFSISGEGQYWKLTIEKTASKYQPWVNYFGFFGYISTDNKPECLEGSRWTEQCNICTCRSGYVACTNKICLPECIEGSYWTDDCNICECYEGHVTCTTKNCLSDPVPTCTEGSRWYETSSGNCNTTCICSNGITTCTEKICPPEEAKGYEEWNTVHPMEMYGGREFPDPMYEDETWDGPNYFVMSGPQLDYRPELESCRPGLNGEQPLIYQNCLDCTREGCQACDDCANISKCHIFNARTCKCHKKFRCKV